MDELLALIRIQIHAGLFLVALIDATGAPFPGRLLIVTMGAFAATAGVGVTGLVVATALGAVAGDHLWYLLGRLRGEQMLGLYCRLLPGRRNCVDRAYDYIARFGALVFVIGRFIGGVRILAAPVASVGGVSYAKFLVSDTIGALLWSATFVVLGYAAGARAPALLDRLGIVGPLAIGAGVTVVTFAIAWLVRRFSRSPRGVPRRSTGRPRRAA